MPFGAAALVFVLAASLFGWAPQQDTHTAHSVFKNKSPQFIPRSQCTWLDRIAYPTSHILDRPLSPLLTPNPNSLRCLWSEQLAVLDRCINPPLLPLIPLQSQSTWIDALAPFDFCDIEPLLEDTSAIYHPGSNMLVLVVLVISLITTLKLWFYQYKSTTDSPVTTAASPHRAALVIRFQEFSCQCWTVMVHALSSVTSCVLRRILFTRELIFLGEHRTLLDRIKTLEGSLAALEAAKASAEQVHQKKAISDASRITQLETELSQETSRVTTLEADKETAREDATTATAMNGSLATTNESLVQDMATLRDEMDSATLDHLNASKQHEITVTGLTASLATANQLVENLGANMEAKTAENETLATRITAMQSDLTASRKAQITLEGQIADTSKENAVERSALAATLNTAHQEISDLKELMAAVFEEKEVVSKKFLQLTATTNSEIAELQAKLTEQEEQNGRLFEQFEAEGAQINLLLDTIVSIREELDAVEATANLELDPEVGLLADCRLERALVADDLAQTEMENSSLTESLGSQSSLSTTPLVDNHSGPWNGIVPAVEHKLTPIHAATNVLSEEAHHANSAQSEDSTSDVVESESDTFLKKETQDQRIVLEVDNEVLAVSIALPMSPPITPPNNAKALFKVDREDGTAFANVASSALVSDLWETASPASNSTPCPSPAHSQSTDVPTRGLSHQEIRSEARTRNPRSALFSALRAASASCSAPAPSIVPEETPTANPRPHSWDMEPDRVYPPESNAESHRRPAMDYGPNWHRLKSKKRS